MPGALAEAGSSLRAVASTASRSVRVVASVDPVLAMALTRALSPFYDQVDVVERLCPEDSSARKIGLMVAQYPATMNNVKLNGERFSEHFLKLDACGVWEVVALGCKSWPTGGADIPCGELRKEREIRVRFGRVSDLFRILEDATESCSGPCTARRAILSDTPFSRRLRAWRLWSVVERFSHGQSLDIANACLAPMRILLQAHGSGRRVDLTVLRKLLEELPTDPLVLGVRGRRLVELAHRSASDSPKVDDVTELMDLLTAIRAEAGIDLLAGPADGEAETEPQPSPARTGAPHAEVGIEPPLGGGDPSSDAGPAYKVVVVDDFWDNWSPVFNEVKEQLRSFGEVEFRGFGNPEDSELFKLFHDADLVILDIFFGGEAKGLQLLQRVRDHCRWLPVIMWTSSRDMRLPARANLANGFLFKKSTTLHELVETVRLWLDEGKARRTGTLANRWFDQQVKTVERREMAYRFQLWCLTEMSAFHLLDEDHLHFFNDHGGRHLIKVLDNLERLFKPLWDDHEVFSECLSTRQDEVLALFLATFVHEIGMFPFEGEEESYDSCEARSFHGPRGMLRLWDCALRGEALGNAVSSIFELSQGVRILARVATLVGYHTRKLNLSEGFLRALPSEFTYSCALEEAFAGIRAYLSGDDAGACERLRKQCALFRLADGIDVDQSRNPADLIRQSKGVKPDNRREYLKRQVIQAVILKRHREANSVCVTVAASPPGLEASSEMIKLIPSLYGIRKMVRGGFPRRSLVRTRKKLDDQLLMMFDGTGPPSTFSEQIAALSAVLEIVEEYRGIIETGLDEKIRLGEVEWTQIAPQAERSPLVPGT